MFLTLHLLLQSMLMKYQTLALSYNDGLILVKEEGTERSLAAFHTYSNIIKVESNKHQRCFSKMPHKNLKKLERCYPRTYENSPFFIHWILKIYQAFVKFKTWVDKYDTSWLVLMAWIIMMDTLLIHYNTIRHYVLNVHK